MAEDDAAMDGNELRARPGPGAPVEADADELVRVDELFASAVDRQVAEQRNLNRVLADLDRAMAGVRGRIDELQAQIARDIAPTVDRIGTLDASVRALRETGSQQSVTLRAELDEGLNAIRDDVRGQRDALGGDLSSLQDADRSLAERLEDVARTVEGAIERLDARQAALAEELNRVAGRLTDAAEAAESTRDGLGPLGRRLEDRLEEIAGSLGSELRGRIDELVGTLEGGLASRLDELATRVDGRLDSDHGRLADRLDAVAEQVEGLGSRVEGRGDADRDDRDRRFGTLVAAVETVAERLDHFEARDAGTSGRLTAELAEVSDGLGTTIVGLRTELGERLGSQGMAIETLARDLRAAFDDRLSEVEGAVREQLAAVRDQLDDRLAGFDGAVGDHLSAQGEQLRSQLETQRTSLDGRLGALEAATEGAVGRIEGLGARLGSDLEELTTLATALTRSRELEDEARETLRNELVTVMRDRLDEDLGRLLDRFEVGVAGIRAQVDEQLTGLDAHVVARLDRSDEQQQAELSGLAVRLEETLGTQRDQVTASLAGIRSALEAALGGQTERIAGAVADLRDGVGEQLGQSLGELETRLSDTLRAVEGALDATRAQLGTVDDAVRGSSTRIEAVEGAIGQQTADLARVADDVQAMSSTIERILEQVRDELRADQTTALSEVTDVVRHAENGLVQARETVERVTDEVRASNDQTRESVTEAVSHLRSEVDRAASSFDEQVAATSRTLEGHVSGTVSALEDRIGRTLAAADERVAATGEQLHDRLSDALDGISAESRNELSTTRAELHEAALQLESVAADLGRLESTFVGYLEQRDARLEHERVVLLRDLVEQLADNLSKRERRKLANKLEVPPPPAAPTAAVGPTQAAWSTADRARPSAGSVEPPAASTSEPLPPTDETTPARNAPAAVGGSTTPPRERAVRRTSTRGETRARLEAVKGLGPAKVDALMATYGSIEAILAADVEELVAIKGVGPALAQSIREQLGA